MKFDTDVQLTITLTKAERTALEKAGACFPIDSSDASLEENEVFDKIDDLRLNEKKVPKYLYTARMILEDIKEKINSIENVSGWSPEVNYK